MFAPLAFKLAKLPLLVDLLIFNSVPWKLNNALGLDVAFTVTHLFNGPTGSGPRGPLNLSNLRGPGQNFEKLMKCC